MTPEAVTGASDLREAVDHILALVARIADDAWGSPAYGLDWTCGETIAHVMDDFAYYAMQLSGVRPPQDHYVELIEGPSKREGGPSLLILPDPATGTAGIVECLDATAGLLCAVTSTAPAERRGFHPFGLSDASGFAAMGVTEAVLHAFDILAAQGIDYRPETGVCSRVLSRLFPEAKRTDDPWQDLLAATGRTSETRGQQWRWDSSVRPTSAAS